MDRPRFQVHIGTMMVAVLFTCLVTYLAIRLRGEYFTITTVFGIKAICFTQAKARCKVEGREWSEADRIAWEQLSQKLGMWFVVPAIAVSFIALVWRIVRM